MNILESNQQESDSVEMSEADFLNPLLRAEALSKLNQNLCNNAERQLIRPHINVLRTVLNVLIPLLAFIAVFCTLYFTVPKLRLEISLGISFSGLTLYIIIRLRALMIWCILVYQRFAPSKTRLRCVFQPSCSEYAILALKKYGVIRGIPRIISRLKRCHPPNGGNDPLK